MEVEDELIQIANVTTPRIIKVIGVGGGGGNAVGQMYRDNIPEVRYLVANTDKKALDDNIVPDHLQLGPGLGAGGDPERGAALANECLDQINAALDDETKMVFVTAGMGGGTGTGASPVIAHAAREKGILTVGIVTIPFLFEREKQIDKALDGLDKLSKEVDAMLVINNQRLCDIYSDLSIINAFKRADETLSTAVSSITEIISMHGRVNLDFQDVNTTLRNGGVAVMSTGYAEGENRVTRAINDALNSPLLNNNDVFDASHILIAITTSSDDGATLRTGEVDEINAFMGHFNSDIETKWGLAFDPQLGQTIKFTIIASGFGLYGTKKRERNNKLEVDADDADKLGRRGVYYGTSTRVRRRARCYIFNDDDLNNEALLKQVEEVPTFKRSAECLQSISELSHR
jgi:cell division protein FtsZ